MLSKNRKQCHDLKIVNQPGAAFSSARNSQKLDTLYSKSKICVKRPLSKRPNIGFQDQLSLIACQKYCRMLEGDHSAKLLTFIKLPFVIKIFVFVYF